MGRLKLLLYDSVYMSPHRHRGTPDWASLCIAQWLSDEGDDLGPACREAKSNTLTYIKQLNLNMQTDIGGCNYASRHGKYEQSMK